jgi:hypothetical protein
LKETALLIQRDQFSIEYDVAFHPLQGSGDLQIAVADDLAVAPISQRSVARSPKSNLDATTSNRRYCEVEVMRNTCSRRYQKVESLQSSKSLHAALATLFLIAGGDGSLASVQTLQLLTFH